MAAPATATTSLLLLGTYQWSIWQVLQQQGLQQDWERQRPVQVQVEVLVVVLQGAL